MFIPVNLRYTSNHLWLREVGRQDAYIGITDFAQKELGRIDSIEIKPDGYEKKQIESFGLIYGANKSMELTMPLTGRILIVNPEIIKHPGILNSDPYDNWIILFTSTTNLADNTTKYLTSMEYQIVLTHFKTLTNVL